MQATADSIQILVGDNKTPLTLTDSAVEAVQGEAAGLVELQIGTIFGIWNDDDDVTGWDAEVLLTLRDAFQRCLESVEVLIDCRPAGEFEGAS